MNYKVAVLSSASACHGLYGVHMDIQWPLAVFTESASSV